MQTEYPHALPDGYTYLSHRALVGTVLAYPYLNGSMPAEIVLTAKFTGKNGDQTDVWLSKTINTNLARNLAYVNLSNPNEYRLHFYNLRPCQRRGNWQFEALFDDFEWNLDGTHNIDSVGVDISTYGTPWVFDGTAHIRGLYKDAVALVPGTGAPRATKSDPACTLLLSALVDRLPFFSALNFANHIPVADPTTWRTDSTYAESGTESFPDIDTDLDAELTYAITLTLQ